VAVEVDSSEPPPQALNRAAVDKNTTAATLIANPLERTAIDPLVFLQRTVSSCWKV